MPMVELPSGRPTSAIGFGGAVLGGGLDRRKSLKLIDAALDAGIRHFDVAPAYGLGLAEDILGEALAPHRDIVSIATKVGIGRPSGSHLRNLVRGLARPMKTLMPRAWVRVASNVRYGARGDFAPEHVVLELEESLRRLRTSQVDLYLMHQIRPADMTVALRDTLISLQEQGRVGAFGSGVNGPQPPVSQVVPVFGSV